MNPQTDLANEPLGSFGDYKKVMLVPSSDLQQLKQFSERLDLYEGSRLIANILDHLRKQIV